jgi:hypothetical protein
MMEPSGTQTCPQCDALSPQVGYVRGADGEYREAIIDCSLCRSTGKVTLEQARQWEEEMRTRYAGRKGFSG